MSLFIRLLGEEDKGAALGEAVRSVVEGAQDPCVFEMAPESFEQVPGAPFAYWVAEHVQALFRRLPPFEDEGRMVRVGLQTSDDFRFVRAAWEPPAAGRSDVAASLPATEGPKCWWLFAKGGAYAPFYADVYLCINWAAGGQEAKAWAGSLYNNSHCRTPDMRFLTD
jgi:hypothetical protein